ncbi:MAG: tRNA dihydrouridine synthase DusB [Micropepsaceae bacterium]
MSSAISGLLSDVVPVIVAPMSGVTDAPFRCLARRYGASLTVTEMVASDRLADGEDDAFEKLACDEIGGVYAVQLAGCRPEWMAEAARIAADRGAALIDINMGCPAKRVVGGYAGSALMRDLDVAERLIAAAVGAVAVPVSVKMRLGWDRAGLNAPDLAQRAERLGAVFVSVHGRTRCDFYKGQADWAAISATKQAVTIPVFANGDIGSVEEARRALALSGGDGVLVGRAAVGRPWLLGEIAAALNGRNWQGPDVKERLDAARSQLAGSLDCYGAKRGLLTFRKHLAAYLAHEGVGRETIAAMCRIEQPDDLDAALQAVWPQPALEAA